jgi:hypothetical protein
VKSFILLITILAAAACGKTEKFTDGGDDDSATVDATTAPDAPATGELTVFARTRNNQASLDQAGVEVFVVGPDLTIGDRAVTDSSGRATLTVTGGDSVTAVYPPVFSEHYITTVAGVAPGDTLTFGDPDPFDYTQTAPMTFNWPAIANAYLYEVYTSCGGYGYAYAPTTSTALSRYAYCTASTADVVIIAYDPSYVQIGAVSQTSVPWTDNGSYTMAGLAPLATLDLSLTGLPPEIDYANLNVYGTYGDLWFGSGYASGTPAGGTIAGTARMPPGATALRGSYSVNRAGFRGQSGTRAAPGGGTFTIANPSFLPWIGENGSVNAGAREIIWIQDSEGADTPDALTLQVQWQHYNGKFYDYFYWDLVLPPGTPSRVQIPPLPANLSDLLLETDQPYLQGITMYETDALQTWADVRAQPEWLMKRPDQVGPGEVIPDVRYSGQGGQAGFQ